MVQTHKIAVSYSVEFWLGMFFNSVGKICLFSGMESIIVAREMCSRISENMMISVPKIAKTVLESNLNSSTALS